MIVVRRGNVKLDIAQKMNSPLQEEIENKGGPMHH